MPLAVRPDPIHQAIDAFSATAQALTGGSLLSAAPDLPAAQTLLGRIGNVVRPAALAADAILLCYCAGDARPWLRD
jgi:hypothetical protein